jgi:hypothetical protein
MKLSNNTAFKVLSQCIIILLLATSARSQSTLPKIGIVYFDSKGLGAGEPLTQLARIELSKLNIYEVLDRYDIEDVLKMNKIKMNECLDKDCILKAGKLLKSDYMLSGSLEKINDKVLIMIREFEVSSGNTTKTITKEFSDDNKDVDVILEVSLKEMYGIAITDENKMNLNEKNKIPNAIYDSKNPTVSMGGPRFGFGFLTGTAAEFAKRSKEDGGLDGYPAMFQFGYQFEKMYLNEGNLQAIFEFIPTISGVDQGHFIPSFTVLNGFRSSKSGWEIAFGPTLTWSRAADMYKLNDKWVLSSSNPRVSDSLYRVDPTLVVNRNHTSGDLVAKPGLLIGAGKTFKSGKLNMPLNVYIIPRKGSFQFGISYGFNTMRKS